jgi:hypothetical protein
MISIINSAKEEIVSGEAANRNGYRKSEQGGSSTCYIRAAASEQTWVPLTRDWTSR